VQHQCNAAVQLQRKQRKSACHATATAALHCTAAAQVIACRSRQAVHHETLQNMSSKATAL
jgi:hypothetical protein